MALKKKPASKKAELTEEKKENLKIIREFVNTPFKEIKPEKKENEELINEADLTEEEFEEDFSSGMSFFRRRSAQAAPSQLNLEQTASTAPAPAVKNANNNSEEEKPFSYTGSPVGYAALGYEPKTENQKTRQETWTIQQEGRMEKDSQSPQQAQYASDKEADKGSEVLRKRMF